MQRIHAHHYVSALSGTMAGATARALDATRLARDAATELGEHVDAGEDVTEKLRAAFGELEAAAADAEGLRDRLTA